MNRLKTLCICILIVVLSGTIFLVYKQNTLEKQLPKYRIVIADDATELTELLAKYFQKQIRLKANVELDIVSDKTTATEYEIVLGDTSRTVSQECYDNGKYHVAKNGYTLKNVNHTIVLGYSDSLALLDAFEEFFNMIVEHKKIECEINKELDEEEYRTTDASTVRVMSHNIYNSLDKSFNGRIPYQARAELMAECYLRYKPDFIGLQEADQALREELYAYIADEYTMVEFDEMSENNWCPLFYRKDLYDVSMADYYMLSSSHYCEWALYSNKTNPEQRFIHINLHYKVERDIAEEQAKIVNDIIKNCLFKYSGVPLAITGDYNVTSTDPILLTMLQGMGDEIQSGAMLVNNDDSKIYTWHYLGDLNIWEYNARDKSIIGPIDHVMVTTKLLEVQNYQVIHDAFTCWSSDHYPIFLDVKEK